MAIDADRIARLPRWPADSYGRAALPERVLMFGTGGLLRALVATAVDDANRAGTFHGGIVAVQSTASARGNDLSRQHGLFTLVERGLHAGVPTERTRLIGSIARAIIADENWDSVRNIVAQPELRVITSNVTEAAFRADDPFPARLADLLRTRFERAPGAEPVFIIPTELVPDNGPRLRAMVGDVIARGPQAPEFIDWFATRVRFCSSLVDRITTGIPAPDDAAALSARLGYSDSLMTVTEPDALWAIEAPPDELRAAFPVDDGARVVFAPDISFFRDRKLGLLNAAHTALAPLAVLAGVSTVRAATEHPHIGTVFRRILFDELVPGAHMAPDAAAAYAQTVWERFRNPWLEHPWRTIATNQAEKMRIRVIPAIIRFHERRHTVPQGLALALAAHLSFLQMTIRSLDDDAVWGASLRSVDGLAGAVSRWLSVIERDGAARAAETFAASAEVAS